MWIWPDDDGSPLRLVIEPGIPKEKSQGAERPLAFALGGWNRACVRNEAAPILNRAGRNFSRQAVCGKSDLNRHALNGRQDLNLVRLPISPFPRKNERFYIIREKAAEAFPA